MPCLAAQASGQHFPGLLTTSGVKYADIAAAGAPMAQWDALPSAAKCQILLAIGFLELFSESSDVLALDGQQHYVRGGKPGYFPKLKGKIPHPIPFNLWDPTGQASKQTPEAREKSLLAEINNGPPTHPRHTQCPACRPACRPASRPLPALLPSLPSRQCRRHTPTC